MRLELARPQHRRRTAYSGQHSNLKSSKARMSTAVGVAGQQADARGPPSTLRSLRPVAKQRGHLCGWYCHTCRLRQIAPVQVLQQRLLTQKVSGQLNGHKEIQRADASIRQDCHWHTVYAKTMNYVHHAGSTAQHLTNGTTRHCMFRPAMKSGSRTWPRPTLTSV